MAWLFAVAVAALPWPAGATDVGPLLSNDGGYRSNSRVTTDFAGGHDAIAALVAQPDGTVVAAGSAQVPHPVFALARYRNDGTLDPDFGDHGKVTSRIGPGSLIMALGRQADGKLVAGGTVDFSEQGGPVSFALARYLPDGRLDRSFGDEGVVITDVSLGGSSILHALVIQADGRIVVAGNSSPGLWGDSRFALARYLPDGRLDLSFDGDGIATTDLGPGHDVPRALLLQPDGRLVAVGLGQTDSYPVAVRYLPDGAVDPSFGQGGIARIGGPMTFALSAALQPDGRIVVGGCANGYEPRLAVARLLPDGSPDPSFGDRGEVATSVGRQAQADAVIVQPDGKIAAAGPADVGADRGQFAFLVVRYQPDGTLDRSLDGDGIATTDFMPGTDEATAVTIDVTGHLVAGGMAGFNRPVGADFALVGLDRPLVGVDVPPPAPVRTVPPGGRPAPDVVAGAPPSIPVTGGSTAKPVPVTVPSVDFGAPGRGPTVAAGSRGRSAAVGTSPSERTAAATDAAPATVGPPQEELPSAGPDPFANLRFSPTGRAKPRPSGPNGPLVLLATVLILSVSSATVTVRHAFRDAARPPQ